MNKKQIIVVVLAVAAMSYGVLFPTWARLEFVEAEQGTVIHEVLEHRFITNPPAFSEVQEPYIRWRYTIQSCIFITVVGAALCYSLRDKKKKAAPVLDEAVAANAAV